MRKNLMKNKKAWLRIIEAFIAIILILSAVLIIISKQKAEVNKQEETAKLLRSTLDYISKDDFLRSEILSNKTQAVNKTIEELIPSWIGYSSRICSYEDICSNPANYSEYASKTVYAEEKPIYANLTYMPEKVIKIKIFFWKK